MDSYLIDYLRSGRAWLLIGSGPSTAAGEPSWKTLAEVAVAAAKGQAKPNERVTLDALLSKTDYPGIFEVAGQVLTVPELLRRLGEVVKPRAERATIYEHIARWPVPVYLTTNYDDEIGRHLTALNEHYLSYTNSEDHIAYLLPEASGIICKLHGDLRSAQGLILTASQYAAIDHGVDWQYWRTRLTSIFQMNRVVVIGHSLTDPHVRHVLEAAKQGSGVLQPVCWIAPNVSPQDANEYLEKWRIRVIPYDNRDGKHSALLRLVETITDFIPARTSVHIQQQIESVSRSPLGADAAAPGFYVFNRLSADRAFEDKRVDVVLAALQSMQSQLPPGEPFELMTPLHLAGWPADIPLPTDVAERVATAGVAQQMLVRSGNRFLFSQEAGQEAASRQKQFAHMRDRFRGSLRLRLKRQYPALEMEDVNRIAIDIDDSLTGYFREGGLTLASTLMSASRPSVVPGSIVRFISESANRYDDSLRRQAFCTVSVDAFVRAGESERDYLGRVSQGYFAFHALGVFGDAARERLRAAAETVWLIDSSVQIPAIALAAQGNSLFHSCLARLKSMGIRLFTTARLFDETREHLWFADWAVGKYGAGSPVLFAGAVGDAPFRKSNVFLQGFLRWQGAGNPADWERYLYEIGGRHDCGPDTVLEALRRVGVEVVEFDDWPASERPSVIRLERIAEEIADRTQEHVEARTDAASSIEKEELLRKAKPEAEALVIVLEERGGCFHILSEPDVGSPAWFISNTSVLNLIHGKSRITWQPDAFVRFASTLSAGGDAAGAEKAFEVLVWSVAESGLTVIEEDVEKAVLGGVIDQATLEMSEQRDLYQRMLSGKYSEPIQEVTARIRPRERPLAALQLTNQAAQEQDRRLRRAEEEAAANRKRAARAEEQLRQLEKYAKKHKAGQAKAQRSKRRGTSKKGRRGRKRR
jgi:hypothetical protein